MEKGAEGGGDVVELQVEIMVHLGPQTFAMYQDNLTRTLWIADASLLSNICCLLYRICNLTRMARGDYINFHLYRKHRGSTKLSFLPLKCFFFLSSSTGNVVFIIP